MCDNENCAGCAACTEASSAQEKTPGQAPIDRLYAASRAAMAEAFPAYAAGIEKGVYHRFDELYACDALAEKGLHNLPHRLSDDKLTAMLDEHLETLFDGLSQSMHDFYAKKLASAKS